MAGYIGTRVAVPETRTESKSVINITATTTSLTGLSYTPTQVEVFHNGVRLVDGTDFTATNGTSITLTTAAQNGDQVVVLSSDSLNVANVVPATGGTFSGNVTFDGGNVLVGKTTTSFTTAGTMLYPNGEVNVVKSGIPLYVHRLDTDGEVVRIVKDNTTTGRIGVNNGDMFISGTAHGIKFDEIDAGTMYIRPCNEAGTNENGQIDLGQGGNAFRDGYLTGGLYFSPHSYPANYLDDYEEGTWTPDVYHSSSNNSTWTQQNGYYRKVGSIVHCWFVCDGGNSGTSGTFLLVGGLPFTPTTLANNIAVGIWGANNLTPLSGNLEHVSATIRVYNGGNPLSGQTSYITGHFSYTA